MKRGVLSVWIAILCLWITGVACFAEDQSESPWVYVPPVVGSVNGEDISAEEFMELWNQMLEDDTDPDRSAKLKSTEGRKRDVLEQLIIRKLLTQRADEMGIDALDSQVEQRIRQTEIQYKGGKFLDDYLRVRGMTREDYVADVRETIKVENLLNQEVYDEIIVEPDEVKDYYDAHPDEFLVPEQIRGRHILIKVAPEATEDQRKEALAAIQSAAKRIRKGEPFEEVARAVSQEPAAVRGGDMGYFSRHQMKPEFAKVAFSLDVGEVSEVFETEFGYHLIKVEDRLPPTPLSFEAVKPKVEEYVRKKKQQEAAAEYIEQLRDKAVIFRAEF